MSSLPMESSLNEEFYSCISYNKVVSQLCELEEEKEKILEEIEGLHLKVGRLTSEKD